MVKLAKDASLINDLCSSNDIDVMFNKVKTKGARKITFTQFNQLLAEIGFQTYAEMGSDASYRRVVDKVVKSGGPSHKSAPDVPEIVKKLTDASLYTGGPCAFGCVFAPEFRVMTRCCESQRTSIALA
jgi:hypothetical protein